MDTGVLRAMFLVRSWSIAAEFNRSMERNFLSGCRDEIEYIVLVGAVFPCQFATVIVDWNRCSGFYIDIHGTYAYVQPCTTDVLSIDM